ncbi:MAG TPA: MEDS domain-containing protein [Mycobacteriales bacterium]|nr:MEDS domain-containing protein [Mycobacteriales bacterium]
MTVDQSAAPTGGPATSHAVHFYGDDEGLIRRLAAFVTDGIVARETCAVIATPAHRTALQAQLRADGISPRPGQLVLLDAAETLQRFMRSGHPDPALFDSTVGAVMRSAAGKAPGVRAFGEMVAVLWRYGNVVGALELEELWSDLQTRVAFPLLCAYPSADERLHEGDGLAEICARHTERMWD